MKRNLIVAGVVAVAVLAVGTAAYFIYLRGGDEVALAQLDRLVRAYDGAYASATYDVAGDRLIVDGLVLRDYAADADAEPLDLLEIGHLEITGLARFSLRDAVSAGRAQQIFSALNASDVALTEDDQTIRMETVALRGLSMDEGEFVPIDDPTREQILARALLLLNATELRITGFESPAQGLTGMRFAELALEGARGGQVASIEISQVSLWDEGRVGTVGDTIRLDADLLSLAQFDAQVPLSRIANGERVAFDRQSDIPRYARFGAERIAIEQETGEPLEIAAFSVENTAYEGAMPTHATWTLSSLRMPFDTAFVEPQETAALRELGYEDLVFSFRYQVGFDVETQVFELTDASVGIEDMAELRIELEVSDVPFTEDMVDRTADMLLSEGFVTSVLENAAIRGGRVAMTDRGIVERVINLNAARADLTPEAYLENTIADLEAERQEVASSELAAQTMEALITFFSDPGTISVAAAPDEPVPLHQVYLVTQINPLLLVELLNLHVTAEPPPQ